MDKRVELRQILVKQAAISVMGPAGKKPQGPFGRFMGRLGGKYTKVMSGGTVDTSNKPNRRDTKMFVDRVSPKSIPSSRGKKPAIDLKVNVGGGSVKENLKRVWKRKDIKTVPTKLMGSVLDPISTVASKVTKSNSHLPYSHTVSVNNRDKASLGTQLGRAKQISERRVPLSVAQVAEKNPIVGNASRLGAYSQALKMGRKGKISSGVLKQIKKQRAASAGGSIAAAAGSAIPIPGSSFVAGAAGSSLGGKLHSLKDKLKGRKPKISRKLRR